jgi:hypothetical protein
LFRLIEFRVFALEHGELLPENEIFGQLSAAACITFTSAKLPDRSALPNA